MTLRDVAPPPASPVSPDLLDGATTLPGALAGLAERFPDLPCVTFCDRGGVETVLTTGRLWTDACAVQASLAARGFSHGDVALLVLATGPELLAGYFGVMLAGGVPGLLATPSNRLADHRVYAARVGTILRNAGATVLYTDGDVAALLHDAPDVLGGAQLLGPADAIAGATATVTVDGDDLATVQYSSGSTGAPRGVLVTHRAILTNLRAMRTALALTPADVSVNWVPLYHDMGLIGAFLLPLLTGCPTVLIPTMAFMRDPSLWLWAIHHYRGTLSWAPNFAYTLCAQRIAEEDLAGLDLSSWRIAINAAEPVLASTLTLFADRFARHGFRAAAPEPAWGLAENVVMATAHPVGAPPIVETIDRQAVAARGVAEPTSDDGLPVVAVGRCLPGNEVQVRDDAGRPLPDGRVGQLWLRSDCLFRGYRNDAAATARALVDGWLDTGDRGYLRDGHLFFLARDKDLIVVGGEKYPPHDVETAINRVPGVREGCAVAFGILDPARGTEDVAAVVETRETDADAQVRLRDAIRTEVMRATGLALRWILLVPAGGVEKTSSGKLARTATRTRYAAQLAQDAHGRL